MPEMKIAVMGAAGRMGRELVRAIAADPGCRLSGGTEAPGSPDVGRDLGELAGLGANGIPGDRRRPRFDRSVGRHH